MKWKSRLLAATTAAVMLFSLSISTYADTPVRPKAIKFSNVSGSKTIMVGNEFTVEYEVLPPEADTSIDVTFSSSDPDVAGVDDDGNIYAYAPGETTITARTGNNITKKLTVKVPGRVTSSKPEDTANDTGERDRDISRSSTDETSTTPAATSSKTAVSSTSESTPVVTITESGLPLIKLSQKLDRETLLKAVRDAGEQTVKMINYKSVSADTLRAAAEAGSGSIRFDTRSDSAIIGRLTVYPDHVKNIEGDLKVGVYCKTSNTARVDKLFENFYKNDLRVIRCDQTYFHMPVKIAIKAGDLKMENIRFYGYDPNQNNYYDLTVKNVKKDSGDYLHFTTEIGGYIIVSDGELKRK